jgi:6-phosphogluconolactonase
LEDSILNNLTESIADSLTSSISLNGSASFVVCGGNSPLQLYKNLSSKNLDWSKVSIFLGDDRVLPADHKDSNNFLIHKYLIKNNATAASFHALLDHKDSMEGIKRPFDVVLLGLGNDGHFASLFPAQLNIPEAFDAEASPTIIVSDQELGSPSYKRVSMNLSLLTNTKRCILLVPSSEKRKIVETAYTDNQLPLHFLLTQQKIKVEFSDLDF